jgi:hypothetical protein
MPSQPRRLCNFEQAHKREARRIAINIARQTGFFARKADHGRAEAVLIALYGLDLIERERTPSRAA